MKKIRTSFKTIGLITIVLVIAQGCVQNSDSVNPLPYSGAFNVNISNNTINLFQFQDTSIVIDTDTLTFKLGVTSLGTYNLYNFLYINTNATGFEFLSVKKNRFDYVGNFYLDTLNNSTGDYVNTIDSGILISNNYTAYSWNPFLLRNATFECISALYTIFDAGLGVQLFNGLPKDKNQFIVLRKMKDTQYQYYWIKARRDTTSLYSGFVNISNGKYQMNSIITGQ